MKAGNFTDINQIVRKFVECCTDQTDRADVVLHYRQTNNNQRGRRDGQSGHYRGNFRSNRNRSNSYYNNYNNINSPGSWCFINIYCNIIY